MRQKDPGGNRMVLLSLTAAGRADVEDFQPCRKAAHGRRFEALSQQEQQTLTELLEKLLASWDAQTPEE